MPEGQSQMERFARQPGGHLKPWPGNGPLQKPLSTRGAERFGTNPFLVDIDRMQPEFLRIKTIHIFPLY